MFTEHEMDLMDLYVERFGETPPIAFLDPDTSKRLMRQSLSSGKPFSEKDLKRMDHEELIVPMMKMMAERQQGLS